MSDCSSESSKFIFERVRNSSRLSMITLLPSFLPHPLFNVCDNLLQRSSGAVQSGYPQLQELGLVVFGNYPSANDEDLLSSHLLKKPLYLRKGRHVGSVQQGQRDDVHVFVDRHPRYLLWGGEE